MAKEKPKKPPTPYLLELVELPAPLGLISRELFREVDLLKILCFRDNEYGAAANVVGILQRRMVARLNERFRRCGKKAVVTGIVPSKSKHHCMVVSYLDAEGVECDQLFTLFEPSRRMRSAERDKNAKERGLSKPRRGAKVKTKKKKKRKSRKK